MKKGVGFGQRSLFGEIYNFPLEDHRHCHHQFAHYEFVCEIQEWRLLFHLGNVAKANRLLTGEPAIRTLGTRLRILCLATP